MILRSLMLVLCLLIGGAPVAEAACALGQNNWPAFSRLTAQRYARQSERVAVRTAYRNGTCTITAILHRNGNACIRGRGNNHVTVRLNTGVSYHVFNYRRPRVQLLCTTP